MTDTVYFDQNGVMVSVTRFVVGSQTFAVRNITSVRLAKDAPPRGAFVFVLLAGLGLIAMDFKPVGIGLAALGALLLVFRRTTYAIMVATAAGEVEGLRTADRNWATLVTEALNVAISANAR